jgi:hypothetical protein
VRSFWPPADAAQVDYERLRAAVLAGCLLADPVGARFARGGLAALIARPVADPIFVAVLVGASRPAWSPYADPRLEALAAGYGLVLKNANHDGDNQRVEVAQ